ncbi:hypothetical protein CFOL_v3_10319 [Cephalotus follicularis]|uniref:PHD-type zinc finger plants domain-containing protein n=1 Tax=Cephalotus follicularis TaxID=3775 RepID=A0A1Q3BFZ5_CEPFO|nr:hypothetical protein CFOL_v3_10319 [Cephalotus follicularis]
MTTEKEANIAPPLQVLECCMCGDCGLSNQLFKCKVCHFRSQHSYCSNRYPKAESYGVCNWCLSDTKEKSQKSSNSYEDGCKSKRKNINSDYHSNYPRTQEGTFQLQLNSPIKKPRSPDKSSSPSTRKRINITDHGASEEKIRRTKSEEIANSKIIKHVFKNKVKRYKLLDEVSS